MILSYFTWSNFHILKCLLRKPFNLTIKFEPTNLFNPSLLIEVPVPSLEGERSYISVLEVSILALFFTILHWIFELFRQLSTVFLFIFYLFFLATLILETRRCSSDKTGPLIMNVVMFFE